MELVALIRHDCPVCDQLLPALAEAVEAGAPLRLLSQSSAPETAEQAVRCGVLAVPAVDERLAWSRRLDPDAVPAVVLLDGEQERDRVEGLDRDRLATLFAAVGAVLDVDGLPARRAGCAPVQRERR